MGLDQKVKIQSGFFEVFIGSVPQALLGLLNYSQNFGILIWVSQIFPDQ
jgi:hypothetical protein